MTTTALQDRFRGPYQKQLAELAELIDWLWTEHDKSFVKAGDDRVYAFGGNGYIIVLDEAKWDGTIEFITPSATMTIKPGEGGAIAVEAANQDEKGIKQILRSGTEGLRSYYERRYWSTPKQP
ncbi:MAG TPA: hypothetical protein VFM05_14820 [Candidatus Saccharimonadales bacterium]|nr:hypothetical protein [Candidatus Saccharimonadales bacterium]